MSDGGIEHVAEPKQPLTAHEQGDPSDFWEYAAMRTPDHNKLYYLKGTIAFLAFYFLVHLVIHVLCNKYNRVY